MSGFALPPSPCSACGAPMDPARATYDKNGNLVCQTCASRVLIAEGDARAVGSTVGSAIGIFIGGALCWTCANMFFVLSIVITTSAIGWLVMIARNAPHRAKMGGRFVPALVAVLLGLLLSATPLLLFALGATATILGR
ncbi:MAG: hypothetical protein ABI193_08145 [Minicystis sp.]